MQFAVLAAIGLTVAAAVIVALVRQAYATQAEQRAIARARLATELVLDGRLHHSDLAAPVKPARRDQLDRLFATSVLRDGIFSGTLYSRRAVNIGTTMLATTGFRDERGEPLLTTKCTKTPKT